FIMDNITLNRVDQLFDNFVLFSYVVISMAGILLLYAGIAEKLPERWVPFARKYSPLLIQFAFGGLLSGMLIFYGRSGAWAESWPFLAIILFVIYGNETLQNRSSRLVFNLGVFFVGLFSYIILVVPVATGYMGPWVFVGSGVLALIIMRLFLMVLYRIIPNFLELQIRAVVFTIGGIFVGFNFLYFANIIPPIPLSLKDVGIYHSVVRFENGDYQLKYEAGPWWQPFRDSNDVYRPVPGGNIFCFAQVFAPTRLNTDIYHQWEYYDEEREEWIQHVRLSYAISGGRDRGFRGYTLIENYRDGDWRCTVETGRGQVLGRENFVVHSSESAGELITEIR
ncbi:MAG: DUF2914 domain-containing protein, partial [Bacteroidota bacterium]